MRGFVYVLSNSAMPGLYKIGFTTGMVVDRINQLSSATGVPVSFDCERIVEFANAKEAEAMVHHVLFWRRINHDREFFRCDLDAIDEAIAVATRVDDKFFREAA